MVSRSRIILCVITQVSFEHDQTPCSCILCHRLAAPEWRYPKKHGFILTNSFLIVLVLVQTYLGRYLALCPVEWVLDYLGVFGR